MGVFAAHASAHGYALLDKRLFIPDKWFSIEYQVRRQKCKLPKSVKFKTKPELASEMFKHISEEGVVPFRYVV